MTAVEIRAEALDIIRHAQALVEGGWTQRLAFRKVPVEQGSGKDRKVATRDCYCAGGAFAKAGEGSSAAAYRVARDAFEVVIGHSSGASPTWAYTVAWNDTKGRTQEEVVAAFQRAQEALQ